MFTSLGYYAAVFSSRTTQNNTQAWLTSPTLLSGPGSGRLSFWYHVPHHDFDSLAVYTMDGDNLGQSLWSHGSHGRRQWSHAEVNVTATSGHPL